ncbi:MAG: hypothetical protein GEU80_13780 [Dehalococcoidia bacterium]|nr:hypothetical protein [Dehalococcoidia bacterium]
MTTGRWLNGDVRWGALAAGTLATSVILAFGCTTEADDSSAGLPDATTTNLIGAPTAAATPGRGVTYIPWDEALERLPEHQADIAAGAASSVPETIPEYAVALAHFWVPNSDDTLYRQSGDRVTAEFFVANTSSRPNPNVQVLCLGDLDLIDCSPDHASWNLDVPGMTAAFLQVNIDSSSYSRFELLLLPSAPAGYPLPWSTKFALEVGAGAPAERPTAALPAHERVWPWEGCGFIRILIEPPPTDRHRLPVNVDADSPLYALIESCRPDIEVDLVAIADRERVIELPGLPSRVRLDGETGVLEFEPSHDIDELQILGLVVGPVDRERQGWFSDMATFE